MNKEKVLKNITENEAFKKANYVRLGYTPDMFLLDALDWIKGISRGSIACVIKHVSASGMSRNFYFIECAKTDRNRYNYRQYSIFLSHCGYTLNKDRTIRVGGCGMNMVVAVNYDVIHKLKKLGIISKKKAKWLAQLTPTVL